MLLPLLFFHHSFPYPLSLLLSLTPPLPFLTSLSLQIATDPLSSPPALPKLYTSPSSFSVSEVIPSLPLGTPPGPSPLPPPPPSPSLSLSLSACAYRTLSPPCSMKTVILPPLPTSLSLHSFHSLSLTQLISTTAQRTPFTNVTRTAPHSAHSYTTLSTPRDALARRRRLTKYTIAHCTRTKHTTHTHLYKCHLSHTHS